MIKPTLSIDGKLPPHDIGAERAVLSACMLTRWAFDEVATVVKPSDFYDPSNELVFEAIVDLAQHDQHIDTVHVASWLRARGKLDKLTNGADVKGPAYLADIVDATPAVAHVAGHARIVAEKRAVRRVIEETAAIRAEAYNDIGEFASWSSELEGRVAKALGREEAAVASEAAGDVLRRVFRDVTAAKAEFGLRTGIKHLDRLLNGIRLGKVAVIGARSHVGKSMLGRQIAMYVAGVGRARRERQGGVLIWSGEQDREETVQCMMYQHAKIPEWKLGDEGRQYLTQQDWTDLTAAAAALNEAPMWIVDQAAITPMRLRAEIRLAKRLAEKQRKREEHEDRDLPERDRRRPADLKFVLIDYLQLMNATGLVERNANREREIATISRKLKEIAVSERVAIAVAAQLNKDGDKRSKDDSEPRPADLRDSNGIEQDADKIILIHNPHVNDRRKSSCDGDERKDPEPEVVRLIVAKARQGGRCGTVRSVFMPAYGRFEEYDGREDGEQYQ